jgi:hypothetical protein
MNIVEHQEMQGFDSRYLVHRSLILVVVRIDRI